MWFLLNVNCFCTIVKMNYCKLGIACTVNWNRKFMNFFGVYEHLVWVIEYFLWASPYSVSREGEFLIKDFIHFRHPPQFLYCQRKWAVRDVQVRCSQKKECLFPDPNGLGKVVWIWYLSTILKNRKDLDMYKQLKEEVMWEFSGGPVVKSTRLSLPWPGFSPWSRNWDHASCMARPKK